MLALWDILVFWVVSQTERAQINNLPTRINRDSVTSHLL